MFVKWFVLFSWVALVLKLPSERRRWIYHPEHHWQLGLSWIRSPPNDQCHYCSLMFVWAMPPAPPIQYQKSGFVLISCLVVGVVTKMIFSHLWKQYWKVDLLLVGTLDTLPIDLICQRLLPVPTFPPHAWNKWSLKTFRIFYCT